MSLENFHEPSPSQNTPDLAGDKNIHLASEFGCPTTPEELGQRAIDGALKEGIDIVGDAARQHIRDDVMRIMKELRRNSGDGDC